MPVRALFERTLAERGYRADPAQLRALRELERCETEWIAYKARRGHGQSTLDLRLTQISVGSTQVPIVSSSYAQAGERSGRKMAKAAAAGAIIGNNTGNGSSGDGAAIGMGVAMLKPGQTLTIAPGSLLEFSLAQPLTVQVVSR